MYENPKIFRYSTLIILIWNLLAIESILIYEPSWILDENYEFENEIDTAHNLNGYDRLSENSYIINPQEEVSNKLFNEDRQSSNRYSNVARGSSLGFREYEPDEYRTLKQLFRNVDLNAKFFTNSDVKKSLSTMVLENSNDVAKEFSSQRCSYDVYKLIHLEKEFPSKFNQSSVCGCKLESKLEEVNKTHRYDYFPDKLATGFCSRNITKGFYKCCAKTVDVHVLTRLAREDNENERSNRIRPAYPRVPREFAQNWMFKSVPIVVDCICALPSIYETR